MASDYNSQAWREVTERWGRARKDPKWESGPEGYIVRKDAPKQMLRTSHRKFPTKGKVLW